MIEYRVTNTARVVSVAFSGHEPPIVEGLSTAGRTIEVYAQVAEFTERNGSVVAKVYGPRVDGPERRRLVTVTVDRFDGGAHGKYPTAPRWLQQVWKEIA